MAVSLKQGGGNGAIPRIGAALVMLLLVLEATVVSSARSSPLYRRGLLDSADKPSTIAVDLMHVQHVDSPYRQPNLTLTERVQISVANSKRRLASTAGSTVLTSPLQSTQAEYVMQVNVGTPARTLVAIADTGSDLVWLQCSTCTDCLTIPDLPFDPSASSTYAPLTCDADACGYLLESSCSLSNVCGYNYSYGDASFTYGELASETFTLTSSDGSPFSLTQTAFGCGTDDESTTFKNTDGLVGLGNGPLSLVSQLGGSIGYVFSYCLVDYYAATTQTSSLLLGSVGSAAKSYTPLISNIAFPTFYFITLLGITVDGQQIDYPAGTFDIDTNGNGGIIVDSGTTVTRLFDAAYVPFENAVSAAVTYPQVDSTSIGLDLCVDTSSVSSPVFPTVVFQFQGVDVTLTGNNTFLAADNVGTYCLAFLSAGPDAAQSIYGNIQQSNSEIAYDIGNQQLGFNTDAILCGSG